MQICNGCKKEDNFLMNGLCGSCMGLEKPDGILDSGLTPPWPGPIEIYNAFRDISPETFPEINVDGTPCGILDSGLNDRVLNSEDKPMTPLIDILLPILDGKTGETSKPSIINRFWAIDYDRLREFETTVDRLVVMHSHELVDLLALESAMISIVSSSFCEARLRYGMLIRSVERGDGRKEVAP